MEQKAQVLKHFFKAAWKKKADSQIRWQQKS